MRRKFAGAVAEGLLQWLFLAGNGTVNIGGR